MTAGADTPRRLTRGAIHAVAGNATFAASQLVMLVVLARTTSPTVVGEYAVALAVAAPIYMLANLKLRQLAVTDVRGERPYRAYFTSRVTATAVAWFVIAAVAGVMWNSLGFTLLLVSSIKALDSVSDILYAVPHRRGRLDVVSRFLIARGVLSSVAFSSALALGLDLHAALMGSLGAFALCLPYEISNGAKYESLALTLRSRQARAVTRLAAPLGLALAAASFTVAVPRLALRDQMGSESVALFTTAAYVLMVGGLVINSLAQAAAPQIAQALASTGPSGALRMARHVRTFALCFSLAATILSATLGGWFLGLVFGDFYRDASSALTILCLSSIPLYQSVLLGTLLTAYRRFEASVPATTASLAVTAASVFPLVSLWGLNGAALALGLGSVAEYVVHRHYALKGPRT